MAPRKSRRQHQSEIVPIPQPVVTDEQKEAEELEFWETIREEQYEVLEQLPLTLQRMFTLMRELDERYTTQMSELQSTIRQYMKTRQTLQNLHSPPIASAEQGVKAEKSADPISLSRPVLQTMPSLEELLWNTPPIGETRNLLQRINTLNVEVVRTSEEKLALATTAYDLVDRHVRSLDLGIKAEEAALALGLRSGTQPTSSVLQDGSGLSNSTVPFGANNGLNNLEDSSRNRPSSSKGSRKKKKEPPRENVEIPPPQSPSVDANGVKQVPSMPVDPNEPRYCYCNQVSYGEMVACDNDECEREWFHYSCVGLSEAPKRRWFCQECEVALGIQPRKRKA